MLKAPFIETEIQDQYLYDENPRPWIVGFSGGKDSTLLLQLVWQAIQKLDPVMRRREVYVVCNDTLVENPRIVQFIERTLKRIEAAAVAQGMPFQVVRTMPRLEDTFWVKLLGRGYPAPSSGLFRWCTERLKIDPTTRFIKSKIGEEGEVIILLGTREAESARRARSMKKFEVRGQRLRKHVLPNASVYAPLKDVETGELWQYLSQVAPPWGGTHKELVTLYRNANSGDCPLVIDTTTPSCGNSRFGCWVCTVVNRDKSMEGLIENGEDWMLPLMELRDFLVETRDNPERYREKRRRDGSETEGVWGPYTPETRAEILRRLLQAQHDIRQEVGETMSFISHQELVAIQVTWYRDGIFSHNVADVYNAVFGIKINLGKRAEQMREEEKLLRRVCRREPDQFDLIQQTLKLVRTKSLLKRRVGIQNDVENLLDQYLETKRGKRATSNV